MSRGVLGKTADASVVEAGQPVRVDAPDIFCIATGTHKGSNNKRELAL